MVTLSPASIVIMRFPFSDLSGSKLRPAIVLANTESDDWLLCQITSNSYSDPDAIRLTNVSLKRGSLLRVSFARPMKLFTAHKSLISKRVAILSDAVFKTILTATIEGLRKNMPK